MVLTRGKKIIERSHRSEKAFMNILEEESLSCSCWILAAFELCLKLLIKQKKSEDLPKIDYKTIDKINSK